jgi:tRNA C32,U32 (ribose-2'-O)-methylase TrmJ
MCDLIVGIETGTKYRRMNISHALGIILYEITRQMLQNLIYTTTDKTQTIATRAETDLLTKYVRIAAERSGYDMHKRHLLDSYIKRLIAKSNPSSKEVMLIFSLFRKCILRMERQ